MRQLASLPAFSGMLWRAKRFGQALDLEAQGLARPRRQNYHRASFVVLPEESATRFPQVLATAVYSLARANHVSSPKKWKERRHTIVLSSKKTLVPSSAIYLNASRIFAGKMICEVTSSISLKNSEPVAPSLQKSSLARL